MAVVTQTLMGSCSYGTGVLLGASLLAPRACRSALRFSHPAGGARRCVSCTVIGGTSRSAHTPMESQRYLSSRFNEDGEDASGCMKAGGCSAH